MASEENKEGGAEAFEPSTSRDGGWRLLGLLRDCEINATYRYMQYPGSLLPRACQVRGLTREQLFRSIHQKQGITISSPYFGRHNYLWYLII